MSVSPDPEMGLPPSGPLSDEALVVARSTLSAERAWLVGGAIRDRLLGRGTLDLDIVIDGDVAPAARAIVVGCRREGTDAACFALSREFGVWRVVGGGGRWQIDVQPLQGGSLEDDLRMRDFTVNAIAQPLAGGELVDPLGGVGDLAERRLRAVGEGAFAEDPLRVLRLARIAVELALQPSPETMTMAARSAPALSGVSGERVFAELRRIVASPRPQEGLELIGELGATAVVLPELAALRGVEQSRYHHLDVYHHTIEVLEGVIALQHDPARLIFPDRSGEGGAGHVSAGGAGNDDGHETEGAPTAAVGRPGEMGREDLLAGVGAVLSEDLADHMTRGEALRWGALLHDAAKPQTRAVREDGRVTFIGHDLAGARLAEAVLGRLRSSNRLGVHIGQLTAHHLRLGFLVHAPQPLDRGAVFDYLKTCDPVTVDVTLLSIADRLATKGDRSEEAIASHMDIARAMLADALRWHREGPPRPFLDGEDLGRELAIPPGPEIGRLLGELVRARYTGEISSREDALRYAASARGRALRRL